jgi:hypothetical protein
VTTASIQKTQAGFSKFNLFMNSPFTSSDQFTTHKREFSLAEGAISWRGCLKFRTYNPGKITNYGLSLRMVCEDKLGYTVHVTWRYIQLERKN